MRLLYCGNCGNYLMGSNGECHDCRACGWKQPDQFICEEDVEFNFEDIVVEREGVRVTLSWVGEGFNGDYDRNDPYDEPLLRFNVEKWENEQWLEVEDASYCTNLSANLCIEVLVAAAEYIYEEVFHNVVSGNNIRRICENLSHIDENIFGTYAIND